MRLTLAVYRLRIAAALLRYHLRRGDPANVALRVVQLRSDIEDLAVGAPQLVPRAAPPERRPT